MDDQQPPPAFMSALTTQHFVLQSALSANTSEVGTRASLCGFITTTASMVAFINSIVGRGNRLSSPG